MIKITLDTNCVINLLDTNSRTRTSFEELTEIIRFALEGNLNIAITTRVDFDISKDREEKRRKRIQEQINMFPVIGTGARFGITKFGGGDFFVGDEYKQIHDKLREIIYPNLDIKDKRFTNKISDIDHIAGHIKAKRDIFVTDDRRLLKKSKLIEAEFGIKILSPQDCWEVVSSSKNIYVLVKIFRERWEKYIDFLMYSIEGNKLENSEEEYSGFREQFIRTFPKIKAPFTEFRLKMKGQDVGNGQVYLRQSKLESLMRDINPFLKYYKCPTLSETIKYLKSCCEEESFSNWLINGMKYKSDLLIEFEGYLE